MGNPDLCQNIHLIVGCEIFYPSFILVVFKVDSPFTVLIREGLSFEWFKTVEDVFQNLKTAFTLASSSILFTVMVLPV